MNLKLLNQNIPERMTFLNRLNRLLKEKEQQIIERVTEYLVMMEQRVKNDPFTREYEVRANVQYSTSSGNSLHIYEQLFPYDGVIKEKDYGLIFSNEDWRECYMPVLDDPYCYLLHDLIDHSHLGERIFKIKIIWIEVKIYDQQCIKLKPIHHNKK